MLFLIDLHHKTKEHTKIKYKMIASMPVETPLIGRPKPAAAVSNLSIQPPEESHS